VETAADLALQFNLRHPRDSVTPQAAQKWLSGKARPTADKIETLAIWLNVSIQWLRYGIGEKTLPRPIKLHSYEPSLGHPTLAEDEVVLMLRIRGLSEHRRYLIAEIVEQFALDQEIWPR
jgi:transcriptional regulator with XRE-family HTH domain